MKKILLLAVAALVLAGPRIDACSSVIVSGRATADGRPLMLKVRDESGQNNNIQYFTGENYRFLGFVGDASKPHARVRSIVGGVNEAGLCTMSLTTHSWTKDESVKGGHGSLQMAALGRCRNIAEFEAMLSGWGRPLGNISNLGVIDADGGAAYYEFDGQWYTKYDVNDPEVAPDGWRVLTNFSWAGDAEGSGGWDRYYTAESLMKDFRKNAEGKYELTVQDLYEAFGRSFRHEVIGIRGLEDLEGHEHFCDMGLIGRHQTCGILTFQGVRPGENPKYTVMWTQLGYPVTAPAIPLMVGSTNLLPDYVWKEGEKSSRICDKSYELRDRYVYDFTWNGRLNYFNVAAVRKLTGVMRTTEAAVREDFLPRFEAWRAKKENDAKFYAEYRAALQGYYARFLADLKAAGLE